MGKWQQRRVEQEAKTRQEQQEEQPALEETPEEAKQEPEQEEVAVAAEPVRQGAEVSTLPEDAPKPPSEGPKFGNYSYEMVRQSFRELCEGKLDMLKTQSEFHKYVLACGFMEMSKRIAKIEKELGL